MIPPSYKNPGDGPQNQSHHATAAEVETGSATNIGLDPTLAGPVQTQVTVPNPFAAEQSFPVRLVRTWANITLRPRRFFQTYEGDSSLSRAVLFAALSVLLSESVHIAIATLQSGRPLRRAIYRFFETTPIAFESTMAALRIGFSLPVFFVLAIVWWLGLTITFAKPHSIKRVLVALCYSTAGLLWWTVRDLLSFWVNIPYLWIADLIVSMLVLNTILQSFRWVHEKSVFRTMVGLYVWALPLVCCGTGLGVLAVAALLQPS